MYQAPSQNDRLARIVAPDDNVFIPESGMGDIDWGALVNAIPGVLQTGAQVYGSLESGKYNPMATYNVPYGVTPSAAGVSWSGPVSNVASLQALQSMSAQQGLSGYLPIILAGGAVIALALLLR